MWSVQPSSSFPGLGLESLRAWLHWECRLPQAIGSDYSYVLKWCESLSWTSEWVVLWVNSVFVWLFFFLFFWGSRLLERRECWKSNVCWRSYAQFWYLRIKFCTSCSVLVVLSCSINVVSVGFHLSLFYFIIFNATDVLISSFGWTPNYYWHVYQNNNSCSLIPFLDSLVTQAVTGRSLPRTARALWKNKASLQVFASWSLVRDKASIFYRHIAFPQHTHLNCHCGLGLGGLCVHYVVCVCVWRVHKVALMIYSIMQIVIIGSSKS